MGATLLWRWCALVVAAVCSNVARGQGLSALNAVLGKMRLDVDTSALESFSVAGLATVTLADKATCSGMGVEALDVYGGRATDTISVGGTRYQRHDVNMRASKVRLRCRLGLCLSVGPFNNCEGSVTVISERESNSRVDVGAMLLSKDFDTEPPTLARKASASCAEQLNVDGIRFEFDKIKVGFVDLTSVVDLFSSLVKSSFQGPLEEALCDLLASVGDALATFLGEFELPAPPAGSNKLDAEAFSSFAQEAANALLGDLPPSARILDLANHPLANMLLTGGDTVPGSGGRKVDLAKLLVDAGADSGAAGLLARLLGGGDAVDDFDLLSLVGEEDGLVISFDMEGFGSARLEAKSARLSATPKPGGSTLIDIANAHTAVLPALELDDVTLSGVAAATLVIDTTVLGEPFKLQLDETFDFGLDWQGFVARAGALLALDLDKLYALPAGPLADDPVGCAFTAFHGPAPAFAAAALGASDIGLTLSKVDDGLMRFGTELLEQAISAYQVGLPGMAASAVLGMDLALGDGACAPPPPPPPGDGNEAPPYDFSTGPIAEIAASFTAEMVSEMLGAMGDPEGGPTELVEDGNPWVLVGDSPNAMFGEVMAGLGVSLHSLRLTNAFPPPLDEFRLLRASSGAPQLLQSALAGWSADRALRADIVAVVTMANGSSVETNELSAFIEIDRLSMAIDLLATLSQHDVEAMALADALEPNCWLARLDAYGGIQTFDLGLGELKLGLECERCESAFIAQMAASLAAGESSVAVVATAKGLLESMPSMIVDMFEPRAWGQTVLAAWEKCGDTALARPTVPPLPPTEAPSVSVGDGDGDGDGDGSEGDAGEDNGTSDGGASPPPLPFNETVGFDAINDVLRGLSVNIDTSAIGTFAVQGIAEVTLDQSATCTGLGIKALNIAGARAADRVTMNNRVYDRFDLSGSVEQLSFQCTVGLCLESFGEKTCGGEVTIISEPSSQSRIQAGIMLLGPDLDRSPPSLLRMAPVECAQAQRAEFVEVSGVRFEGKNLMLGSFEATKEIMAILNGMLKPQITAPLSLALCDTLASLKADVDGLLSGIQLPSVGTSATGATGRGNFTEQAYETAMKLLGPVPNGTNLLDLQDNPVADLLLPRVGTTTGERFSARVNLGGLAHAAGGGTLGLIAQLLDGAAGIQGFDLLPIVGDLLGDIVRVDSNGAVIAEVNVPGLAAASAELRALSLRSVPPSGAEGGVLLEIVGGQTVSLPDIRLGDVIVTGDAALRVAVSGDVMGQQLGVNVSDAFGFELGLADAVARAAALLAVDMDALAALQVGPLAADPTCAISAFVEPAPALAGAAFDAGAPWLNTSGVQDGIVRAGVDIAAQLLGVFAAAIPALATTALSELDLRGSPSACEPVGKVANSPPYDFSQGIVHEVSRAITPEAAREALAMLAPADDGTGAATLLSAQDAPLVLLGPGGLLSDAVPGVELVISTLELTNAMPPVLTVLELLRASSDAPQLLGNLLDAFSTEQPLGVAMDLALVIQGAEDGPVRNEFKLELRTGSLRAAADLLATLSVADIEAMPLGKALVPHCWLAALDPYGGLKRLEVALSALYIDIDCTRCDTLAIQEMSDKLPSEAASAELESVLAQLLERLAATAVAPFEPDVWQQTVDTAAAVCRGVTGAQLFSTAATAEANANATSAGDSESMGAAHAYAGAFGGALAVSAAALFCCRMGRRPHGAALKEGDGAAETGATRRRSAENPMASLPPKRTSLDFTDMLNQPLFKHDSVPLCAKVLVPVLFVASTVLLVIGHTGDVMGATLEGDVVGMGLPEGELGRYSVLSTTLDLWEGGAYLLAGMLMAFSIVWPYVKLAGLLVCWAMPGRWLSFKRRDTVVTLLDQLGKWSFVELFFVAFVLVLLGMRVASPTDSAILPSDNQLYAFSLQLTPRPSLYTFTTGLLLSLVVSNIVCRYQKRIKHSIFLGWGDLEGRDAEIFSVADSPSFVHGRDGTVTHRVTISRAGQAAVALGVAALLVIFFVASTMPVLEVETIGLVRALMELEGTPTVQGMTLLSFIASVFGEGSAGRIYFGVVLVLTVVVVPTVQLLHLVSLMIRRFTLEQALRAQELGTLLSAWCATEVFVASALLTVLELSNATSMLLQDECSFLAPAMRMMLSLDLVEGRDVRASCVGLVARIDTGSYVFLAYVLLANLVHVAAMRLFKACIETRKAAALGQHFPHAAESPSCCSLYNGLAWAGLIRLEAPPSVALQASEP